MKTIEYIRKYTKTLAIIAVVGFVVSCNNSPSTDSGEKPVNVLKVTKLKVTNNNVAVQKWEAGITNPENGGWYEKADAPDAIKNSTTYDEIDPKKGIKVVKIVDGEEKEEEVAAEGEFKVIVLNNENSPAADTRLQTVGNAKVKVEFIAAPDTLVEYYDYTGQKLNDDYFTVLVTEHSGSGAFAGYTVLRPPVKTVYDWKETFDSTGLVVIKWYGGGTTLEAQGIPVLAGSGDYALDISAYTGKFVGADGYEVSSLPTYSPIPINICEPQTTTAKGSFDINLVIKDHKLMRESLNGEQLSGGNITFYLLGSNTTEAATMTSVTVKFTRAGQYSLNPDSVKLKYNSLETAPALPNKGSAPLYFEWLTESVDAQNAIKTNESTLSAKFTMPAADVTVCAEFLYESTRINELKVGPASGSLSGLYGFSPNINAYTHPILYTQNEVFVEVHTSATSVDFTIDPPSTNLTDLTAVPDTSPFKAKISDIPAGDTLLTITASLGGASSRVYTLNIKKFDAASNGVINYKYTGAPQTFYPPVEGNYKFEAWGAWGGNRPDYDSYGYNDTDGGRGGRGGKSTGTLYMDPAAPNWIPPNGATTDYANAVYIYVGEGGSSHIGSIAGPAAWNGGAKGGTGGAFGSGQSGGGATSVSLTRGAWSDWQVLLDRVLVAGGGGGYGHNGGRAGSAAGLVAQGGRTHGTWTTTDLGDLNPATGYGPSFRNDGYWNGATQKVGSGRGGQGFGVGGHPAPVPYNAGCGSNGRGGGGGGYFGGEITFGWAGGSTNAGAGGGSGYVSGLDNCVSYDPKSSPSWMVILNKETPLDRLSSANEAKIHYSGRHFTEGSMNVINNLWTWLQGDYSTPAPDPLGGGLGEVGAKNRDGWLRITKVN